MKYIVVVHKESVFGQAYGSEADQLHIDGHPAFDCSDVDLSGPYVSIKTIPRGSQPSLSLYLPHSIVQYIIQYAEEEPPPLGFLQRRK